MTNAEKQRMAEWLSRIASELERAEDKAKAKAGSTAVDFGDHARAPFVAGWLASETRQAARQVRAAIDLYLTPKTKTRRRAA